MANSRRGSGLFNLLLGFPESQQVPVQNITPAHAPSLITPAPLWLDGRTFVTTFWPRADTPYFSSYENQKMRGRGCKFFDFTLTADSSIGSIGGGKRVGFGGSMIWEPGSDGTLEMQLLDQVLCNAYYWRTLRLESFAKIYLEDEITEYTEYRWEFCQRCAKFFKNIGMLAAAQDEIFQEVREMRKQEGKRQY